MPTHHLAKRLKLRPKTARITTLNTSTTVAESTISEIQVGSKRFPDVSVLIFDLGRLNEPFGERIDGVLGTDVLGLQKLEIDYRARTLTLEDCAPADFHVAIEAIAHLVSVQSEIAGRPVRLLIDTGASAMQLFADSNTAPLKPARRKAVGYGGVMQVSEATLQAASWVSSISATLQSSSLMAIRMNYRSSEACCRPLRWAFIASAWIFPEVNSPGPDKGQGLALCDAGHIE